MQRTLPGVVAVRETDSTVTIVLDETVFDSTTGGLSATGQSTMRSTASSLAAWPNAGLRVEGHADSTGKETSNLALSAARAEVVRSMLRARGIAPYLLSVRSAGALEPEEAGTAGQPQAANRRVTFTISTSD